MYVHFIKDHFSGIPEGTIVSVDNNNGKRFVDNGFAEEATEDEFDTYVADADKRKEDVLQKITDAKAEQDAVDKVESDAIRAKIRKELEDKAVASRKVEDDAKKAATQARSKSEKEATERAVRIAKEKEEGRLRELTNKIRLEEEAAIANGTFVMPEDKEESLSDLTMPKLKALCVEMGLPEEDYKKLKKDDLVAYIEANQVED